MSAAGKIGKVVVYGSGLMGRGIVQTVASAGYQVTMYDVKKEFLATSLDAIRTNLEKQAARKASEGASGAKEEIDKIMSHISVATNAEAPAQNADLVIEAIIENMGIKKELFAQIDQVAPERAIFASNTSSLSITDLSNATTRSDRFAGLHFFNPVPSMKLVEVVRTSKTSSETMSALEAFAKSLGKTTITCTDTPGFVVNRLLIPYLVESVRMHERGVASMRDIDTAMKLGAGYPMGPFELLDYVGLDTVKFILDAWTGTHPEDPLFKPSPLIDSLVAKGFLGKKTGQGFYSYQKQPKM